MGAAHSCGESGVATDIGGSDVAMETLLEYAANLAR